MKPFLLTTRQKGVRTARQLYIILRHRPAALIMAVVILGSTMGYTLGILADAARYQLADNSQRLIGAVNPELAKKVKLDKNLGSYRFNPEGITPEMTGEQDPNKIAALLASQKQQTGGGGKDTKNLYSLDLPIDPKQGTKVYDTNSKTSFKLVPQFGIDQGRSQDGRVVYPLSDGGQAVYSVKGNGVKEDIVLTKPRGDELNFSYKLELPKTLQARLDGRGNLGIYGVDPAVTTALESSGDTARLKDVQENGTKDYLVYLIPAPTIKQSGKVAASKAQARYELKGDTLTVHTSGLETLTYPISIDPTVVVTSTADFGTGNNESDISFDTDAISRATVTGGSVGTWSSTTGLSSSRYDQETVAYNGFLYCLGGWTGAASAEVWYAPLNADGTVGTWTATTSFPTARYSHTAVAYNGFMYVLGGLAVGDQTSVVYAPINTDGTIGTWSSTTSFTTARHGHMTIAYNGYMYVLGGDNLTTSTAYNDVQYAPINADGTLGTWATTTSFSTARSSAGVGVYNGFVYVVAGFNPNTSVSYNDVQYAQINADGSLGTWATTTSLASNQFGLRVAMYGGYIYAIGAYDSATVQYAPINANGTIGAWTTTTSFATARHDYSTAFYKGYLYVIAGSTASGALSDVQYGAISAMPSPTLGLGNWTATTVLGAGSGSATAKATTRKNHTSVAYNGYVYVIGGDAGTTPTATVHYAPTNANGSLGAWVASANPLPAARDGHASVIVNGYIYVIGGTVSGAATNTVLYSQIGANGANGAWTSTTATGISSPDCAAATYNGYIYVSGGGASGSTGVYYSKIGAGGAPGTWTATTSLPVAVRQHTSTAYNGYLYELSGAGTNVVRFAPINADGTIGSWTTTQNTTGFIVDANTVVYEGYMITDGYSDNFGNYSFIMWAPINADGTLGTWSQSTTTTYPNQRAANGLALSNGYLYVTGGYDISTNAVLGDTQYAQLSLNRAGMANMGTTAVWQTTTATNLAEYGQASAVYNGYVYLVGGYGGSIYRNDVRYAPINADGTIGTWTTSPSTMTMARFNAGAVAYKGYLYVTGGQQGTGAFTNTTEYAPINADGTLGTWTASTNTFTTARYGHTTVAYNGKLYVVGGGDASNNALSDVKYATINANGSIGAWADTTATVTERDTDGFVYGGRLYILGGVNGTTYSNAVNYATINADGTLGAWTASPYQFANGRSRHAVAAANGFVYLAGGGASGPYGDLQYAQIRADGSVGQWATSNSLSAVTGAPAGYYYQSMVAYKGRLYSFAGIEGTGTAQSATYMTTLNAPALAATYSQRINLGQASTLNSIVLNGTLPVDQNNLYFRSAGTNGVYGNWALASTLSGAPLSNVQYVQYKVLLDDSQSSDMFSSLGRSSVTDVTVDYTPPVATGPTPATRLRHNKYFDANGILQPLQTP